MIDRRQWLTLVVGAFAARAAWAQPAGRSNAVLGLLISETRADQASRIEALRAGLAGYGWVEGRNLAIDLRSAEGNYERLPALAAELVALKVDVIVAFGIKALVAAGKATTTIPIVIPATSGDPVALGLVQSLARPGTNITGSTTFGPEIMGKRLQLLKELAPATTRVGILVNPANASLVPSLRQMSPYAKSARLTLARFDATSADALPGAFAQMAAAHIEAVVVQDDTLFTGSNARTVAELAAAQRMILVGSTAVADAGGVIGYGGVDHQLYRRGAYFVDRILRGATPADLPIEQATRFELVVNAGAARALGVSIPRAMALRAERVIE